MAAGHGGAGSGGAGSGGAGSGGAGGAPGDRDASVEVAATDGGPSNRPIRGRRRHRRGGLRPGFNNYPCAWTSKPCPTPSGPAWAPTCRRARPRTATRLFHGPPNSTISTTSLGAITNVAWGRFYLHMTPKAPVGHGAMVMLFDQPGRGGNWYEVGFEYNALQGNWHGNGGEKYMHTKMLLPDKWVCVEFFADGANAAPIKLWMDGVPVVYSDVAGSPSISKTTKFANFTIGLTPYHGLSTINYEGNVMPMTDMWIDDIALDTQRVGCIAD